MSAPRPIARIIIGVRRCGISCVVISISSCSDQVADVTPRKRFWQHPLFDVQRQVDLRGMVLRRLGILFICFISTTTLPASARQADLPKVLVLATGGTIAGEQKEPGALDGYEIKKSVNEVVALVPEIKKYAQVETEQFLN